MARLRGEELGELTQSLGSTSQMRSAPVQVLTTAASARRPVHKCRQGCFADYRPSGVWDAAARLRILSRRAKHVNGIKHEGRRPQYRT